MKIEFNGKKLMNELKAGKVRLNKNIINALKRALDMGRAEMSRDLRENYYLKVADINKTVKKRVKEKELQGELISSDKPIGYSDSPASSQGVKWRARKARGGVQVYVRKRQKEIFRHAFIAKMPTGHVGLFERDQDKEKRKVPVYKNGRFAYNKFLPLKEIFGPSITKLFSNLKRVGKLQAYMAGKFFERLRHENARVK